MLITLSAVQSVTLFRANTKIFLVQKPHVLIIFLCSEANLIYYLTVLEMASGFVAAGFSGLPLSFPQRHRPVCIPTQS